MTNQQLIKSNHHVCAKSRQFQTIFVNKQWHQNSKEVFTMATTSYAKPAKNPDTAMKQFLKYNVYVYLIK